MTSYFVVFATLALIATVAGIDTTPKNKLEENILNLLTKWRAGDKGPFSFPLPALDEIKMPAVSGKYDGNGVKISYATSELKLVGLQNISVEELDASESTLKASGKVTVPSLTLSADNYDIKGRALWFVPLRGSGKMSIIIKNIQLNISVRLQNNTNSSWVDSLEMTFKIGSVRANLENGPTTVSVILNSSGALILESYHDEIVTAVRAQMLPVMNEFLSDQTPEQLFLTIAGRRRIDPNTVQV